MKESLWQQHLVDKPATAHCGSNLAAAVATAHPGRRPQHGGRPAGNRSRSRRAKRCAVCAAAAREAAQPAQAQALRKKDGVINWACRVVGSACNQQHGTKQARAHQRAPFALIVADSPSQWYKKVTHQAEQTALPRILKRDTPQAWAPHLHRVAQGHRVATGRGARLLRWLDGDAEALGTRDRRAGHRPADREAGQQLVKAEGAVCR